MTASKKIQGEFHRNSSLIERQLRKFTYDYKTYDATINNIFKIHL